MAADLPHWHAGFTAVIDIENATVHARGTLDIFTIELLRGAIANLALHHPPRITIDQREVTDTDRYVARLLDDWQRNGVPGSTIPVDIPDAAPSAATQAFPVVTECDTTFDRPAIISGVSATLSLAHTVQHQPSQSMKQRPITIADAAPNAERARRRTA